MYIANQHYTYVCISQILPESILPHGRFHSLTEVIKHYYETSITESLLAIFIEPLGLLLYM